MKNIHTIKVFFGDTDAAGIVFYPNFYRWMDQATAELVGKAVMPVSKLFTEEDITLPLLETFCKYKSPLFFEDIVEVHSQVIDIQNKVLKIEHEFKRDGQLIASGYEVRAWTSKKDGQLKAVPVPENVRAAFGIQPIAK